MSTAISTPSRPRWNVEPRWWTWLLLGIGFLPLLAAMGHFLWKKEHYQFFPMLIGAVAVLAYFRLPEVQQIEPSRPGPRRLLLGLTLITLAAGTLLFYPRLGLVSSIICSLAVVYTLGGRSLLMAWLPMAVALCLIVPPPAGLDETLIRKLQEVVTVAASRLLDVLGVIHLRTGNVLEVPGRRLMVDEACSGIHGLYSGLAFILIYCILMRRPLIVAIPLLLFTVIWVVAVNILRVTAIGLADSRWNLDLTEGWPHTILGLCTFASVIGLVLSTEQLLFFLNPRWALPEGGKVRKPLAERKAGNETSTSAKSSWLLSVPCLGLFALLGLLNAGEWLSIWMKNPNKSLLTESLPRLDISKTLAGWERLEDHPSEHYWQAGLESQAWVFRKGNTVAVISLDYPQSGYHGLDHCYRGAGWLVEDISRQPDAQSGKEIPVTELTLSRLPSRNGMVLFSHLSEDGNWLKDEYEGVSGSARIFFENRFKLMPPLPTSYQMQLFIDKQGPLTEKQREEARALFSAVRDEWTNQLVNMKRVRSPG